MSQRGHSKRFSRDGFHPLATKASDEMVNPNDVTIDIPLIKVTTKSSATGARKPLATSPARSQPSSEFPEMLNEKHAHLHRGPGGRRRRIEARGREKHDKHDNTLTAAGKFYSKIFHFSIVTRYFLYVAPLAIAIAIPIVVGATVAPKARIGGVKLVWFFTWVEVVWVSLWVSKLVSRLLPYLFQSLVGIISAGTRKYALVITALEIPLSLVGWAATSLPTFVVLMTQNPDQRSRGETGLKPWESVVKNILFAALFSTIVFLAEKLLIQLISIGYHRKQFDDKIQESKRNIYLVGLLYDASRALFPMYCQEFVEDDYMISDVLDIGSSGRTSRAGHKRSGSATPMRLIRNVARVGDKVTAAFGNVAHEITGKQVFNPEAAHSIVIEALEKQRSSEALARRIWMSFVLEGRDALHRDDIIDVLGHEHEAEAHEAFDSLDADGNGDVSLEEMILRITELGRERHAIANSMHDVDQAINVLDNLLCTVVFIVVVFIFVAWLNTNFTTTLATTGTALLSLSFVFATTAQEVLGSCIFLFVKHPFDVGDRVDISENQYVVERISLLYTMFKCVKNHKRTQVPNIVLNSLWIDNVSRSKAMREQVQVYVAFDTTLEDIELLKTEMTNFVRDKDNARDFQPDIDVEVTGIAEMNKMELKIEIRHKSNWANEAIRAARRSKFMCALVLALRKVPIYGPGGSGPVAGDKANPTYSVAISDSEAQENKETFNADKEKKRMVPLKTTHSASSAGAGKSTSVDYLGKSVMPETKESNALEGLNKRNPAVDPARDDPELELEKQRSDDIEEVRGILRRESTTGRRRIGQNKNMLAPDSTAHLGAQSIPRIAEPSPLEPVDPDASQRISYFEDSGYPPATPPAPLKIQSQNPYAARMEGMGAPPVSQAPTDPAGRYVPGNAFSQQQYAPPPSQPRKPVPGIGQLKGHLQGQGRAQSPE